MGFWHAYFGIEGGGTSDTTPSDDQSLGYVTEDNRPQYATPGVLLHFVTPGKDD